MTGYSNLLRRTKFATFNPARDQVYTAADVDFGFKRPLPRSQVAAAPYVRVEEVDSAGAAEFLSNSTTSTSFRKATREALFVRKWDEISSGPRAVYVAPERPIAIRGDVQSSLIPREILEALKQSDSLAAARSTPPELSAEAKEARRTSPVPLPPVLPNFLAMSERQFARFIAKLSSPQVREQFRVFLSEELRADQRARLQSAATAKRASEGESSPAAQAEEVAPAELVDLYMHAQKGMSPTEQQPGRGRERDSELVRQAKELELVVAQFLARYMNPRRDHDLSSLPPTPHPRSGLQYSTPTAVESALAAPVPGRILGRHSARASRSSYEQFTVSILGQLVHVPEAELSHYSTTQWFPEEDTPGPDGKPARSNEPGRAEFIITPQIDSVGLAQQLGRSESEELADFENSAYHDRYLGQRKRVSPGGGGYDPQVLAETPLSVTARAAGGARASPKAPGTREWIADSFKEPPRRYGQGFSGQGLGESTASPRDRERASNTADTIKLLEDMLKR